MADVAVFSIFGWQIGADMAGGSRLRVLRGEAHGSAGAVQG
ncbi:MAG: hypothetical protein OJF49_001469 [Ktedonobacterales bacterium]|nr:MAG: hypothetical protein OJF49_001469 [Ktedonobacterales bacterium]